MSEAEKKRRREYKAIRKKRIMIFSLILGGLILLTAVFGLVFGLLNKTHFVAYKEASNVSYKVKLFPNEHYDGEWQVQNQSYVADLTDTVQADFSYDLTVDEPKAEYTYIYTVTATLVVADKLSSVPIYHPIDVIRTPVSATTSGNLKINETVLINYAEYRAKAAEFIDAYSLSAVDAYIDVKFHIDTVGSHPNATLSGYDSTLKLPLIEKTFRPESSASLPTSAEQFLECATRRGVVLFLVFTIVFGALSVIGAAFLVAFIFLTRNHDINYTIKVKRLIAAYKSFIQEITTPFATEGYQLVYIKSFNEMLEVRDTIDAPLLMYENEDATATSFVIPSGMGILYCYEIRVEDYNDIYGITDENDAENSAEDETGASFGAKLKAFFVCIGHGFKKAWCATCAFFKKLFTRKKNTEEATAEVEAETTDTEVIEEADTVVTEETANGETEAEATEAETAEAAADEETNAEAVEAEATETIEATEAEAETVEETEA